MTHLYIEQNTGLTEEVNSSIIAKLYELAVSGDLDASSDLKGRLHSTSARDIHYNYLNNNFQDLHITADKVYFTLADPAVEQILATNWGDGVGITTTQVSSIQHFNRKFNGNKNIQTFNELYLFPNITEINQNNQFNDCTNLKSIDLRNITKISTDDRNSRFNFEGCTNLEYVGDTQNLTYLGVFGFRNCSKLKSIDVSNVVLFGEGCMERCTGLEDFITLGSGVTTIRSCAFLSVNKMPETINLPNLEILDPQAFRSTNIKHVIDLGNITTIGDVWIDGGPFNNCSQLLDVTLPETITTIRYGGFWGCNNIRYVKILANEVPEYSSTDGRNTVQPFGGFFQETYYDSNVNNTYTGKTYPIYVKDELLSQYQAADNWKYVGPGRLRPLSQFATDFPNG